MWSTPAVAQTQSQYNLHQATGPAVCAQYNFSIHFGMTLHLRFHLFLQAQMQTEKCVGLAWRGKDGIDPRFAFRLAQRFKKILSYIFIQSFLYLLINLDKTLKKLWWYLLFSNTPKCLLLVILTLVFSESNAVNVSLQWPSCTSTALTNWPLYIPRNL